MSLEFTPYSRDALAVRKQDSPSDKSIYAPASFTPKSSVSWCLRISEATSVSMTTYVTPDRPGAMHK